jgi:divalent metal cation (Fe/Co/Zn/Cd) transporter
MRRVGIALIVATLLYNVVEGILAIGAGLEAGSVVLVSFGADSYLEVLAAGAVLCRLSYTDEEAGERAEERALRLVGATFLILAAAVVFQSALSLAERDGARTSTTGLLVLVASATLMPALSMGKFWVAARTGMNVLAAEAKETIACSYLTLTTLAGVVAVFLFGWWWIDPAAAFLMVPWLVKEGMEGVRADACLDGAPPCFCRHCFFGVQSCRPTCCVPACC